MRQLILSIIIVVMFCSSAYAAKYELSDDQQKFVLAVLANADIKGANAPMLLQVATTLQKPVADPVQPKLEVVEAPAK